jgi:hypothetical protein
MKRETRGELPAFAFGAFTRGWRAARWERDRTP